MKIFSIAAAALLVGMGALSMASCGNGEAEKGADSAKNVKGEQQGEAFEISTNIRYVDQDSLLAHYNYCKDQEAIISQIDLELQQYQNQLARNLQNRQNAIQQKLQSNGYLSEESYNADMRELQKLDQTSSAQFSQRAQADQQRVLELKKAYIDAIREYIVEYNKEYKYDAILFKDAGLYFNPALDITNEVLTGLNAEYEKKKASEKPAEKTDDKK